MRLILIRHGETPANAQGIISALIPGPGLTGLGAEQAAALPERLNGRDIDALFVSSMIRTSQTAAPLAANRGLIPVELEGLCEISAGSLEGRSDQDAYTQYRAVLSAWLRGETEVSMPGSGDGDPFFSRYDDAVAKISASGAGTAVAVSHAGAMRVWSGSRCANVDPAFVAEHPLGNTAIIELEGSPAEGWTCLDWAGTSLSRG